MNHKEIEQLKLLYNKTSKHSNYQILPESLKTLLTKEDIQVKSRNENERLRYILQNLDPSEKTILDIGGNSGYFSFELLKRKAKEVDFFEGNGAHAEFVRLASKLLGYREKLNVYQLYFDFQNLASKKYDFVLLLNVLHHVGDDYGDKNISIEKAKEKILESVNLMADITSSLVFQLGFCWQGNRNQLLFKNGTKEEMIHFIKEGTEGKWTIEQIGVAEEKSGSINYMPLNKYNILRHDNLGEFLNRPIFIMKSLNKK